MSKKHEGLIRAGLVAGLMLLVAGCATPFEARVQHYQAMPPIQGQTFRIVPAEERRRGSLEFETYAQIVAQRLVAAGFRPAAPGAAPELLVELDYGSGPGRERIASNNVSMSMGWGWGGHGWYGAGRWGWPGWDYPDVYSYSVYPAWLEMRILRAVDKAALFEGRADTTTRANDLTVTIPKLADALFQNFPGERVQSAVVKVPPKKPASTK
jgi:hypothetical protein